MTLRTATVPAFDALPGLVHGFEQGRAPDEDREGARRRLRAALQDRGRLLFLKQVHGTALVRAPWDGAPEADASVSDGRGLLLGIETADCLPVLMVDPVRKVVAAAHAGWRGTAAGVATRAAAALLAGGSRPEDLLAALGPSIGACCYEVGDELRSAFGPDGGAFFRAGPRGRPHLDVRAANVAQLVAAGLREDRIHHVLDCTSCRKDLYPSYRRDGPGGGRIVSFVGFSA
jgi:polyphenol oxidase